eukprot:14468000-Alexandrium_andersonii.AAC.1
MSASLVGSEMCIRDRNRRLSIAGFGPSTARPSYSLSSLPTGTPATRWTCLLYTSDAADDM